MTEVYEYNEEEVAKKVEEDAKLLNQMIEEFVKDQEKKESLLKMFNEISWLYLSAPGSSQTRFHDSYHGGLFEHSVLVFENLVKLNKTFELGFTSESMVIVALLHDFGKAVAPDLKSPHYKLADDWKRKRGINFEYDFSKGFFTNRDRTMFALQYFGIKLTPEEYQAILLNDGLILDENRGYSMKEYPLAFWTQVADNWSARQSKE